MLGIRNLHGAAQSVHHRAMALLQSERAHKVSWVRRPVHPAKAGKALSGGACAHAQARPLGPKPWTSGAVGFPGWGLRVEPSLGK